MDYYSNGPHQAPTRARIRLGEPTVLTQPGDGPLRWLTRCDQDLDAKAHDTWDEAAADLADRSAASATTPEFSTAIQLTIARLQHITPRPLIVRTPGRDYTITTVPAIVGCLMDYATRLLCHLGPHPEDAENILQNAPFGNTNQEYAHPDDNPLTRYLHWHTGATWTVTAFSYRTTEAWYKLGPLPAALRPLFTEFASGQ